MNRLIGAITKNTSGNGGLVGPDYVPSKETIDAIITTFNSSGTLTTASTTTALEYLVIAGGGGSQADCGGGGGAGGYRTASNFSVSASTNYSITIGAGGPANVTTGTHADGSNSVFSSITSTITLWPYNFSI